MTIYDKLFPPKKIMLANNKVVEEKRTKTPVILILIIIGFVISVNVTGFSFSVLLNRWQEFFVILNDMVPPNIDYLPNIWKPLLDTIKMSLVGSLLGSLVAVVFALLASSNIIKSKFTAGIFKFILSVLRTLPTLVTALIATFVFGLGTLAGTIAIFLFTLSYIGKLLYEQIENIDMGSFEALESMGLTRLQSFRYAIVPEILPTYLSTSLFCFEGNVRYASILGYVGAGGLGLLLNERLGWRDYSSVGMILVILAITVFIIERTSEHFRKKLQ